MVIPPRFSCANIGDCIILLLNNKFVHVSESPMTKKPLKLESPMFVTVLNTLRIDNNQHLMGRYSGTSIILLPSLMHNKDVLNCFGKLPNFQKANAILMEYR